MGVSVVTCRPSLFITAVYTVLPLNYLCMFVITLMFVIIAMYMCMYAGNLVMYHIFFSKTILKLFVIYLFMCSSFYLESKNCEMEDTMTLLVGVVAWLHEM